MNNPSILIMGGSGFIGAHLVVATGKRGFQVTYTFAHQQPDLQGTAYQVDFATGDGKALEQCIRNEKPDVVVYCAVPHQADEQTHRRVSVEGVKDVFACLKQISPAALFIYLSTDAVFSGENGPYCEQSQPDPERRCDPAKIYALTRAAGEQVVRHNWPNSLVVRTAIVNGYTVDGLLNQRLAGLVANLKKQRPVPRFTDRYITPTLVDNLVEALLEIMKPGFRYRGVLHIAGSQRITDYEYTCCLARRLGVDEHLVQKDSIENSLATRNMPRNTALDVTFTQSLLQTRLLNVEEQMTKLFER
ncbi:MAG: sugar nucleotide-binding protein [Caldilineaceae bacterium]